MPLFFGRLDYDTESRRRAGRDPLHRPPPRHRRDRRRAAGDRLAGPDVAALLPGPARRADGRPVAPPVRLLARTADRVRGRGPHHGRRRVGAGVGDPRVRDRATPDRPDARHRGHHPAGAGPDRPGPADRLALHPGRPRHRQDRGRAAPRRLPAVRLPRPARPLRGAGGRSQRQLPLLHRRRAARPGRDRRHPGDRVLPRHRGHRRRDPRARPGAGGVDQGRRPDGRGAAPRRLGPRRPPDRGAGGAARGVPVAGRQLPRRRDRRRAHPARCPVRGRPDDAAAATRPPGAGPDGGGRRLPRRPGAERRRPQQAREDVRGPAVAQGRPGQAGAPAAHRRGVPGHRGGRDPHPGRATADHDDQAGPHVPPPRAGRWRTWS